MPAAQLYARSKRREADLRAKIAISATVRMWTDDIKISLFHQPALKMPRESRLKSSDICRVGIVKMGIQSAKIFAGAFRIRP